MLHDLVKITTKSKKRLGRGAGSGKGSHTVGRGQKGHTSRQGKPIPLWFEGGQLPFVRRFPFLRGKLRFNSLDTHSMSLDVSVVDKLAGQDITPETLAAAKLIPSTHLTIKLVGKRTLEHPVKEVRGILVTSGARTTIEQAGGTIAQ